MKYSGMATRTSFKKYSFQQNTKADNRQRGRNKSCASFATCLFVSCFLGVQIIIRINVRHGLAGRRSSEHIGNLILSLNNFTEYRYIGEGRHSRTRGTIL